MTPKARYEQPLSLSCLESMVTHHAHILKVATSSFTWNGWKSSLN